MGLVQPDGLLVVTGRAKEIINAGGVKFAPEILEQALLSNADVVEAGVARIPDVRGVDEVWIALVTRNPVDIESLTKQCQDRVGRMHFRFVNVDGIPKTELGKTAREELRQMLKTMKDSGTTTRP